MLNIADELIMKRFTEGMDGSVVKKLAEHCVRVEFAPGVFVFRQNEEADSFYLLLAGKVDIELGPIAVRSVVAGELLGWSWTVAPYRWRFDARTVESTAALKFDAKALRERMDRDPVFGYGLLTKFTAILADRLESETLQLLNIYAAHS